MEPTKRRNEFKPTIWTELNVEDCEIIKEHIPEGGTVEGGSIEINHPSFKRPLCFVLSRRGNWYWRDTGKGKDFYAEGYIIKGNLMRGSTNGNPDNPKQKNQEKRPGKFYKATL